MKIIRIVALLASVATALVIKVPDDFPTIQQGLNNAGVGDTVLVRQGRYEEQITWPSRDGIRLYSEFGPDSTVIDANGAGRVMTIGSSATRATEVRGFTITGGNTNRAAGIDCQGSPAIIGNRITGNISRGSRNHGGGIYISYQTSPLVMGNEITRNVCSDTQTWNYGGGIYVGMRASPEICYNLINKNECSQGYWNYGAGIYCDLQSQPFIYQNVITDNLDTLGDRGHGAGIDVETQARALIFANIIAGNRCRSGLWNYGGGIKIAGNAALINNTITGNRCAGGNWNDGGGVYCDYNDSTLLKNNIIVQNSSAGASGIYNSGGAVFSTFNDVWGNVGGNYYGLSAGPGDISQDPLFTTGQRGGYYLSQTVSGQPQTSPCVDAGDTLLWTWPANLDSLLKSWTTRTDSAYDGGRLDMGFHYPTGHPVGIAGQPPNGVAARPRATVVRGVLDLAPAGFGTEAGLFLIDAAGRQVMRLVPGRNDVSRLSPGVYFVTTAAPRRVVKL